MTINHNDDGDGDGDGDDGDDGDDDNDDYDIDLYVVCVVDGWIDISSDEVGVVGKPAHQEQRHHPHHHLHNLMRKDIDVVGEQSDQDTMIIIIIIVIIITIAIIIITIMLIFTFLLDLIPSAWASLNSPIARLPQSSSPTLIWFSWSWIMIMMMVDDVHLE